MAIAHGLTSEARLEQLIVAGAALASDASLDAVLQRVVGIAAEVIDARYAAISIVGADDSEVERFVTHGISDAVRRKIGPLPAHHGLLGHLLAGGVPIRVPNLAQHPEAGTMPAHHPRLRTFLGTPIVGPRGPIGNLYLAEKIGGDEFTAEDERLAVLLATMTAAAIENARLHEESAHLLAEVHQLHRTRERFFAMVNHEMRNALAAVYGWSELLVRKRDPAAVPPEAHEVLEAADRAVELITDLLDLSRLDEDRLRPVIRIVTPRDLIRRALGRVTPSMRARQILATTTVAPNLPSISTDARRVEQILVNLLSNAVKYSPPDSQLQISAARDGDEIHIRVQDEGPGIRDTETELIFDVYVTSAESEKQGIGLGLPLSRRLAQLLGGSLWAVPSTTGGEFVLALPIHKGRTE
jgi:signal transduction histidine kinase